MPLVRRSGSRALATGVVLLVGILAGAALAPGAAAQSASTPSSASELRAQADALSSQYFDALERVQALDDDITRNEQLVDNLLTRAKQARVAARARARLAYTSAGTQFATFVDGDGSLEAARRAQLIDRVNAHDQDVYDALHKATRALHKQQKELRATRQAQSDALDELRAEGAAIDAKLAQAEAQEQAEAAAAQAAQAAQAAAAAAATTTSTADAPAASASTTTTTAAPPSAPTPPPDYSGTPGVSPHHDDPFLTCVRQRESGGNYSAVNPAGPYLGAYQFLQSTWNLTATHAGRTDLVGVPANVATPYDQDEMAWALYQWQGKAPWGGSC